ncbi:MAG: hypothetical protein IPQ21_17170 [Betaproteobacteria bacterium]|nr:hypothetical protein [Betaproteobacteria bacterium]
MNAAPDDLHSAWAQLFAAALARCGVAHAVISPGSRSTPLALALAAQLPCTVLHDERVAAFFALGQARASGRPSVVLATSGTAPGHWLPAAMEAREAGLPLLLLSADRPWEVQQAQASQTVDQVRLFGHHAHAFFELGLPDAHPAALRARRARVAAQAVLATRYPLAGAVQVNAHFRKPLEPQPSDGREPWRTQWQALRDAGAPRLLPPRPTPDPQAVAALVAAVRAAPRGVVVAGPAPAPRAAAWRAAVQRFVAASGYVLLAEATSQLRFGLDTAARRAASAPSTRCCVRPRCAGGCGRNWRWRSAHRRCRRNGWPGAAATMHRRAGCCPENDRPTRPAGRWAWYWGRWRRCWTRLQRRSRPTAWPSGGGRCRRHDLRRGLARRRRCGLASAFAGGRVGLATRRWRYRRRCGRARRYRPPRRCGPRLAPPPRPYRSTRWRRSCAPRCRLVRCWRSAIPARCATSTTTCRRMRRR